MRLVFVLFLSCGVAPALAGDPSKAPAMSTYPRSALFRNYVDGQMNGTQHVQHLLVISEFGDAGLTAKSYVLPKDGKQYYRTVSLSPPAKLGPPILEGGSQFTPSLDETELSAMASAIHEMPATNALPPVDDLVLVSFHQGTNWVTHSYDKRALPKVIGQIYVIRQDRFTRNFTVH
jgi:hypothetical protein